jgi:hypothetical protein
MSTEVTLAEARGAGRRGIGGDPGVRGGRVVRLTVVLPWAVMFAWDGLDLSSSRRMGSQSRFDCRGCIN